MSYFDAVEDIEPDESNISEQLRDIKETMKFLADTALELIPAGISKERAKAYWYAQIVTALDEDNCFMGKSGCQMQDTINELEEA